MKTTTTDARATRRRDAMARRVTGDEATRREFHLARLLAACERRASGEGGEAFDARKRTQRLDALDAALASARDGLDDARAATYAARISTVRSSGGGDVAVTSGERDGRGDDGRGDDATTTTTTTTTNAACDATHAVAKRVSAAQRTSVREVRAPFFAGLEVRETDVDGPSTSTPTKSKSKSKTVTARDEIELRRQRAIQEGLTDEMSELASGLRANALALERGLGRSSAALAEVESRLERNVDGARASARRQSKVYRENSRGSCWTWIVLALVGVLFAWTYVVIKMSSVRVRR